MHIDAQRGVARPFTRARMVAKICETFEGFGSIEGVILSLGGFMLTTRVSAAQVEYIGGTTNAGSLLAMERPCRKRRRCGPIDVGHIRTERYLQALRLLMYVCNSLGRIAVPAGYLRNNSAFYVYDVAGRAAKTSTRSWRASPTGASGAAATSPSGR